MSIIRPGFSPALGATTFGVLAMRLSCQYFLTFLSATSPLLTNFLR